MEPCQIIDSPFHSTSSLSISPQKISKNGCFRCGKEGHWAKQCPNKTPNNSTSSPSLSTSNEAALRLPPLRCPYCRALCRLKTSKSEKNPGRDYYACPCKCDFFKWFDELSSVMVGAPPCPCGAGICSLSMTLTGVWYFVCRLKKNFGACEYFQLADSEVNTVNRRHGRKREECSALQFESDVANNDLVKKEMSAEIILESSLASNAEESQYLPIITIPWDRDEISHTDLVMHGAESLDVMTAKALQFFQLMAQSHTPSLKALWRQSSVGEKHTTEGIFPSFDPATSSGDVYMSDTEGVVLVVSSWLENHSDIMQDNNVSWKSILKTFGQAILDIFESMNPLDPEQMLKVAEPILVAFQKLNIECSPFIENVYKYIQNVSTLVSVEGSMHSGHSSQELYKRYGSKKFQFNNVSCLYVEAEVAHRASYNHLQSLYELGSSVKGLHVELEQRLTISHEETRLLKAQVDEIFGDMSELKIKMETTSHEIVKAVELERQRESVSNEAIAALERARIWLEEQ